MASEFLFAIKALICDIGRMVIYPLLTRQNLGSASWFIWMILAVNIIGNPGSHAADNPESEEVYFIKQITPGRAAGDSRQAGFTLMPASLTGIDSRNDLSPSAAEQNRILENGSGVAAGDVDGDGRCDLVMASIMGPNRLYMNQGQWHFQESPLNGDAACKHQASTGVLLADVEGDGDLDMLVNGIGTGTRLFLNDGDGVFSEKKDTGLAQDGGPMSMAMADADGDGDLDLYVAHYREDTWKDLPPGIRPRVIQKKGIPYAIPEERFVAIDLGQGNKPGIIEVGEPDCFYFNNGDGSFVLQEWLGGRFRDADGAVLKKVPRHWGLSVMFRDINGDRWPDLIVCNDFAHGADQVWINRDGHVFVRLSNADMRQSSWSSMAVDVADINRDGHDDFFVVEMLSRRHARRMTQRANYETGLEIPSIALSEIRPQAQRNTLFLRRDDGSYAEIARMAGLAASEWSWATVFLDVDLDGYEDILVANGNNHDLLDGDTTIAAMIAMRSAPRGQLPRTLLMYPALPTANLAFRNRGDLTFEDLSQEWHFDALGISQGMCLADLDGDADLDVVINNLQDSPSLYRNDATRPRIAVRLKGPPKNRQAIGARVRIISRHDGGLHPQSQVMLSGGRYLSSDESLRTFATPLDGQKRYMEVKWPSGQITRIEDIQQNAIYEVYHPVREKPTSVVSSLVSSEGALFEALPASALPVAHLETSMKSGGMLQPLLPRYFGRSGPSLLVEDVDGNGTGDLILGHGQGVGVHVVLRGKHGELEPTYQVLSETSDGDQTDMVCWKGVDGQLRLAVAISNMSRISAAGPDAAKSQSAVHIYKVVRGQLTHVQALPGQTALPGCLELLDYDGDGDMDLFVGGRMNAGRYPAPAISRLYRNHQDYFRLDLSQSRDWFSMGLVTDAHAIDLDLDGDPDLMVACEWGPIRYWENTDGAYVEKTGIVGLSSRKGMWTCLEVADLDGDGDPDVLAGNWGRNTHYEPHLHHPLRIYHGDLDENGTYDLVESYFDPESGTWVPARDLIALGDAFPFIRERYRTYAGVASSSLASIFEGISPLNQWASIESLESVILWNREGKFEWEELPNEAQWTPTMSLAAGDFNSDGRIDVFVGQNYHALQPEISRYDAGLGLILMNQGQGIFRGLQARESGIRVLGEQTAALAADWNGDGRMDLLVGQTAGRLRGFIQTGQPLQNGVDARPVLEP